MTRVFEEPFDIADPNIWARPRFKSLFLAGLIRDGHAQSLVGMVETWIDREKPNSLESFISMCRQQQDTVPDDERVQLKALIEGIAAHAHTNETCYQRDTPEKTRVIQWPNNPNSRDAPGHYFDIFEDDFYRDQFRRIEKTTPIGSAGSCFAMRIAHQLQHWEYNYVIEEDSLPPSDSLAEHSHTTYRMAPARIGTLFNTPSMRQMVERAFGYWEPDPLLVYSRGKYFDPFRTVAVFKSEQEYVEDTEKHTKALNRALLKCDFFILTLGLTEAWQFAHNGDYISVAPSKVEPTLVRQKNLTVAENVAELERIFEVYRKHKPDVKLILSVSPVPLNKTFSKHSHVVAANSLSKSILRVAVQEFVDNHPGETFYFPSFEAVTYGTRNPWESDMRHVSPEGIGRVMRLFQKMFLVDQKPLPLFQHHVPPDRNRDWVRYWGRMVKRAIKA